MSDQANMNWGSMGNMPVSGQVNMHMSSQPSMPMTSQGNMPITSQANMPVTGQANMPVTSQANMSMTGQPNMSYMPQTYQQPAMNSMMDNTEGDSAVYPEVFYRLKPYIEMTCDLIAASGSDMPSRQQLESITDNIYDDFCKANPDMADYLNKGAEKSDPPGDPPLRGGFMGGFRPGFGFRGFRRRGIGRDFITALLLSELLGRGGYYYY